MKKYIAIASIIFLAGCSNLDKPSPNLEQNIKKHSSKIKQTPKKTRIQSYDWTGYYHGNVIDKDKKMIKTFLKLVAKEGKMGYFLYENDGKVRENRGLLTLLHNGSYIKLQNGRLLLKGDDFVAFVSALNKSPDKDKILEKMQVFLDDERRLFVDDASVVEGSVEGEEAVQFEGVLNSKNHSNYKSLKAVYVINCDKKTYAIAETTYYKDKFATGSVVDMVKNKEGAFFGFDSNKDVMFQVYKKYCKAKK